MPANPEGVPGRRRTSKSDIGIVTNRRRWLRTLYLLLFPKGPLQAALRNESRLFGAVFRTLREIDTAEFIREGRVYGGGLYKMEPKELGRLDAEPVVRAMGGWKLSRQRVLFADA